MKSTSPILLLILIIFYSCGTIENDITHENDMAHWTYDVETESDGLSNEVASFTDSPEPEIEVLFNELIIEFYPSVPEERRESLRNKYQVVSYRTCGCTKGISKYELWVLPNGVGIEPTVRVIKEGDDVIDILRVSGNFAYRTPMYNLSSVEADDAVETEWINHSFNDLYLNKIKTQNSGITIAVLDTGIDTDFPGFSSSFLYNSANNGLCNEESGWDFVNQDSNPFDDYSRIHGTVVSYVIHRELNKNGIDHQILPVKVADSNGNATFFDTLCGLNYAIEKQADVINMSLGWYSTDSLVNNMFSGLIDSASSILVTSAGNRDSDNDLKAHYPSGFSQNHVLAIAAASDNLQAAAAYSNFGSTSVDFYAVGNKIRFPLWTANTHANFTGTSFAAPLVTSRVAELLAGKNRNIRSTLIDRFSVNVSYSKPVSYKKRIQ